MYDGLDKVPINKMNFNQLRRQVQELRDLYEVLIRRYPELSQTSASSGDEFEIDWANIVTELIRAQVNKLMFTAVPNYSNAQLLEPGQIPGANADKSLIYMGEDETGRTVYWYWNGNEWRQTYEKDIWSRFEQSPAGFFLKGVLELMSDTGGRMTISDSFLKMYPEGSDSPKIQIGYDPVEGEGRNNSPVIIFGEGDYTKTDHEGNVLTRQIANANLRYEQGILTKTDKDLIIGTVSEWGIVRYLDILFKEKSGDDPEMTEEPGLYFAVTVYKDDGTVDAENSKRVKLC